jgi:hypothetical protein
MIEKVCFIFGIGLSVAAFSAAARGPEAKVDSVIDSYTKAVGGTTAIDRIQTREVEAKEHKGPKLVYYWQRPDKILLEKQKQKIGYDGSSGWMLSQKKRVTRLPKGAQVPLEQDANPIRYVRLKALYSEINPAPPEIIESRKMDVLVAPNELGATKFYFDCESHLLARIEETGETSAYYKHTTDFTDYRDVDGIKFPFQILHTSTEPGIGDHEIRISRVTQNLELKPSIFERPSNVSVTLGGKR